MCRVTSDESRDVVVQTLMNRGASITKATQLADTGRPLVFSLSRLLLKFIFILTGCFHLYVCMCVFCLRI